MDYDQMLHGLTMYVMDGHDECCHVSEVSKMIDECLRRYVEWQGERDYYWAKIPPEFLENLYTVKLSLQEINR